MKKAILFVVPVLVLVIVFVSALRLWGGLGNGNGGGYGAGTSERVTSESDSGANPSEDVHAITIEIVEDKIYFDGELCSDENDLKSRITDIGAEKEYDFVHDKAIKATYDKVYAVLLDLEDALGIIVND